MKGDFWILLPLVEGFAISQLSFGFLWVDAYLPVPTGTTTKRMTKHQQPKTILPFDENLKRTRLWTISSLSEPYDQQYNEWYGETPIPPQEFFAPEEKSSPQDFQILSYGTGGNSFGQPIAQPEASLGRKASPERFVRRWRNIFRQNTGAYNYGPLQQQQPPELSFGERMPKRTSYATGGRSYGQPLPPPELSVGRGSTKEWYTGVGQKPIDRSLQSYGSGSNSFAQPIGRSDDLYPPQRPSIGPFPPEQGPFTPPPSKVAKPPNAWPPYGSNQRSEYGEPVPSQWQTDGYFRNEPTVIPVVPKPKVRRPDSNHHRYSNGVPSEPKRGSIGNNPSWDRQNKTRNFNVKSGNEAPKQNIHIHININTGDSSDENEGYYHWITES